MTFEPGTVVKIKDSGETQIGDCRFGYTELDSVYNSGKWTMGKLPKETTAVILASAPNQFSFYPEYLYVVSQDGAIFIIGENGLDKL